MSDNTALTLAQRRVQAYASESDDLMKRHAEAMECRDCEDFLRKGIETHNLLRSVEKVVRESDCEGISEFSPEAQDELDALYVSWLKPCEFAELWIASLRERGYTPDNLDEFRKACVIARDTVESRDWQLAVTESREVSSAEEPW